MNVLMKLWADEVGVVLSAETVMVGTIGVLALTAGVGTMATAVNCELGELGMAFRSFNQSFSVPGFQTSFGGGISGGGGSFSGSQSGFSGGSGGSAGTVSGTVGSSYTQAPVGESRALLQMQFSQAQQVDQEMAGRVIQRLDAAQLQQLQQFSDLNRNGTCDGSAL
ncbi:MAG: hypothetical protein O3B13_07830 [Planctomycetota bacterium]|nr:hypothetical protein [Planctomycetota bacterium]